MLGAGGGDPEAEDLLQTPDDVRPEDHCIKRTGHRVSQPVHPAGQEGAGTRQAEACPEVPATGSGYRAADLGIDHRGAEGQHSVEAERENEGRTGDARGDSGEGEDTGADHRPDTHHRDVEEFHVPRKLCNGL